MTYFENHTSILSECVLASIENLAFADVEPIQNSIHNQTDFHTVQIALGELGHLDMSIANSALDNLASVILTLASDQLDEASKRDTLMEIINIVAGRFCHDLIQEDEEFNLGLPNLGLMQSEQSEAPVACAFAMDGVPALQFRYFPVSKAA